MTRKSQAIGVTWIAITLPLESRFTVTPGIGFACVFIMEIILRNPLKKYNSTKVLVLPRPGSLGFNPHLPEFAL